LLGVALGEGLGDADGEGDGLGDAVGLREGGRVTGVWGRGDLVLTVVGSGLVVSTSIGGFDSPAGAPVIAGGAVSLPVAATLLMATATTPPKSAAPTAIPANRPVRLPLRGTAAR
jgi:hypothetical protein